MNYFALTNIIPLLFVFILSGCNSGDSDSRINSSTATSTSTPENSTNHSDFDIEWNEDKIKQYYFVHSASNTDSDIVVLYSDGGPSINFNEDFLDRVNADGELDVKDIMLVHVRQAQTMKPEAYKAPMTYKQVEEDANMSAAILYQVTNYFKKQGKTVYVQGGSHGFFVAIKMIAEKSPAVADAFVLGGGRLDVEHEIIDSLKLGNPAGFAFGIPGFNDGDFLIADQYWNSDCDDTVTSCAEPEELPQKDLIQNVYKMNSAIGKPRYTQLLAKYNDFSNIAITWGTQDDIVGPLTQEEIDFLSSKNADLYEVVNGTHSEGISNRRAEAIHHQFGFAYK